VNSLRALGRWIGPRLWLGPWLLTVSIVGYPWLHNLVLGVEITAAERGYGVAVRAHIIAVPPAKPGTSPSSLPVLEDAAA
jgi:hypothetical protein